MREAKDAGFWIVQLYVQVSLETALERNRRRHRSVPEDVLREYVSRLDDAVQKTLQVPGMVDCAIMMNNDRDDMLSSGSERWGKHLGWVQAASQKFEELFGPGHRHFEKNTDNGNGGH